MGKYWRFIGQDAVTVNLEKIWNFHSVLFGGGGGITSTGLTLAVGGQTWQKYLLIGGLTLTGPTGSGIGLTGTLWTSGGARVPVLSIPSTPVVLNFGTMAAHQRWIWLFWRPTIHLLNFLGLFYTFYWVEMNLFGCSWMYLLLTIVELLILNKIIKVWRPTKNNPWPTGWETLLYPNPMGPIKVSSY